MSNGSIAEAAAIALAQGSTGCIEPFNALIG